MKKLIIGLFILFCLSVQMKAQFESSDQTITRQYDNRSLGLGLGYGYGGILGFQYTHYLNNKFGLLAAGGFVIGGDLGGGVGVKYRPWVQEQPKFLTWYFMGMYGPVGGGFIFINEMREDTTFYGANLGIGIEVRDKRWKRAFFKFAFHLVHDFGAFDEYKAELLERDFELDDSFRGFTFSLGYHYAF